MFSYCRSLLLNKVFSKNLLNEAEFFHKSVLLANANFLNLVFLTKLFSNKLLNQIYFNPSFMFPILLFSHPLVSVYCKPLCSLYYYYSLLPYSLCRVNLRINLGRTIGELYRIQVVNVRLFNRRSTLEYSIYLQLHSRQENSPL